MDSGFHGLVFFIVYPFVFLFVDFTSIGLDYGLFIAFTFSFLFVWILTGLLIFNILRNIETNVGKNQSVNIRIKELLRDDKLKLWYEHRGYIIAGIFIGSYIIKDLVFRLSPFKFSTNFLFSTIIELIFLVIVSIHYLYKNNNIFLKNFTISFYIFFSSLLLLITQVFFQGPYNIPFVMRNLTVLLLTYVVVLGRNYLGAK